MLQIRKNVPMPEATVRAGTNMQLLMSMEEGNSVYFDAPIAKKATRFYRVASKLGAQIAIRKEGDGVAMWLVKAPTKKTNGTAAPVASATPVGRVVGKLAKAPKATKKVKAAPAKKAVKRKGKK